DGASLRIVEAADATPEESAIGLCWGGLMLIRARHICELIEALDRNNAKREFYLTGIVGLATDKGLQCRALELPAEEMIGVNTRAELTEAEALMQRRLRRAAMDAGVTLVAPETVFLSADTRFGRDAIVEPNVAFGPGVTVGQGARICSFSYLEGAEIGPGARSAHSPGCVPARSSKRTCTSAISSRSKRPGSAPGPRPITSLTSATARLARGPISAPA